MEGMRGERVREGKWGERGKGKRGEVGGKGKGEGRKGEEGAGGEGWSQS